MAAGGADPLVFPWGAAAICWSCDSGFRGAAIHTGRLRQLRFGPDGEVAVGGGLPLMALIRETASRGLAGLEGLGGIPGTLGGAIAMNAGAGGQEMAGVVRSAVLAGPDGEENWEANRLAFGYRQSAVPAGSGYRRGAPAVHGGRSGTLADRDSASGGVPAEPTIRYGSPNAGSVFRNPPGEGAWKLIEAAGLRGAQDRRGAGLGAARQLHRQCRRRHSRRHPDPDRPHPRGGKKTDRYRTGAGGKDYLDQARGKRLGARGRPQAATSSL